MKIAKVILLSAIMAVMAFAQTTDRRVSTRITGEVAGNPRFEWHNNFDHDEEQRRRPDGSLIFVEDSDGNSIPVMDTFRVDDITNRFNIMYRWNVNFGVDFGERVSVDVRLSNPGGLRGNNINELTRLWGGSAATNDINDWFRGWIMPMVPNAFITVRPNTLFSFTGGLLEVRGNTALNLVSGVEALIDYRENVGTPTGAGFIPDSIGLWTSRWNWNERTNTQQAGFRMDVNFSESLRFGFATIAPSPVGSVMERPAASNDFRFIVDAEIGGEAASIRPSIMLRSFNALEYDWTDSDGELIQRTPVLATYGVDADLNLADAFRLELGAALGHIRFDYGEWSNDNGSAEERETGFGALLRVAPTIALGFNEISLAYSFGVIRNTHRVEDATSGLGTVIERDVISSAFNDLSFAWNFRMNENVSFGPMAQLAFRRDRYREIHDESLPGVNNEDVDNNQLTGIRNARVGFGFRASF